MASKRRLRRKSCSNKQRYKSQTEAVGGLIALGSSGNVRTYKCKFCKQWHIGHFNHQRRKY